MSPNDNTTLHEKDEPRMKGLMSMMDIMGPSITCDRCGRWQRLGALTESDARKQAIECGWVEQGGQDLCRICSPGK